jgi:hypothetical protein
MRKLKCLILLPVFGWSVAAVQVNQTFAKKFHSGLQKSAPNESTHGFTSKFAIIACYLLFSYLLLLFAALIRLCLLILQTPDFLKSVQ